VTLYKEFLKMLYEDGDDAKEKQDKATRREAR
jgi:hypothetical protein